MSYKTFKLTKVKDKLGVFPSYLTWLPKNYPTFEVSHFLRNDLKEAEGEALDSEKAKSEMIVTPIIKELKRKNPHSFGFFSGYEFNVDTPLELKSYCDFILTEAKKGEVEEGFGQCGAAMYAAQLFNERQQTPQKAIYGCVTNAFSWAFLKLEGKNLYIDTNYVPLTFAEPQREK